MRDGAMYDDELRGLGKVIIAAAWLEAAIESLLAAADRPAGNGWKSNDGAGRKLRCLRDTVWENADKELVKEVYDWADRAAAVIRERNDTVKALMLYGDPHEYPGLRRFKGGEFVRIEVAYLEDLTTRINDVAGSVGPVGERLSGEAGLAPEEGDEVA